MIPELVVSSFGDAHLKYLNSIRIFSYSMTLFSAHDKLRRQSIGVRKKEAGDICFCPLMSYRRCCLNN